MRKKSLMLLMLASMLALSACQDKDKGSEEPTPPPVEVEDQTSSDDKEQQGADNQTQTPEKEEDPKDTTDPSSNEDTDKQPPVSVGEQEVEATLYFADQQLLQTYRIVTKIPKGKPSEQLQATLDLWVAGPKDESLQSLLPKGTTIRYVKEEDGVVYLDFSAEITGANLGSSAESFIIDQIATMAAQFGYSKTQILVAGEQVESLLGHMYIAEPVEPLDPENFPLFTAP